MDKIIRFMSPMYCDIGPHDGQMRVDVRGSIYLSMEEYERYREHGIELVLRRGEPEPDARHDNASRTEEVT